MRCNHFVYTLCAACMLAGFAAESDADSNLTFETGQIRLQLAPSGEVLMFADRATGKDYLDHAAVRPFAFVTTAAGRQPVTKIEARSDHLLLTFGQTGISAEFKLTVHERHMIVEVVAITGEAAQLLDLFDLPLTLAADPGEPLAACVLALNLRTNVQIIPQASRNLRATCYRKLGMVGAKAAVLACPPAQLRDLIKAVVLAADELPHSPVGGPWALDAPQNRESYILECTGQVGEKEIDRWIRMLSELGIRQLDFHCGQSFRFGDLRPNPKVYPNGIASAKGTIDKLHAAGMLAGLHTYSFFMAKDSSFVTPVPNRGLAYDAIYTPTETLPADATTLPVTESTAKVSAITGFFIQNSITLRIDDELITYKSARKDAPFAFTECTRGAFGTKAAAHSAGSKAYHLKEMFGLFVPDPDSQLFTDVIAATADTYNQAGFDMIYLDALDGSSILGGGEWAWYYGSKFVFELARRLNKPALFEMSTFHHHLWYVRSRMGAWDCPARAPKLFIDLHRMINQECNRIYLPAHLGWWAIFDWKGIQPERTTPDVLEYLGCKCLADGCGLSFPVGFTADAYEKSPNIQRLGRIVRQFEDLRRSGKVPEHVLKRLGTPGEDFTLMSADPPQFRPVYYDRKKLTALSAEGAETWMATNKYAAQPLQVRIEVLLSAADYDAPESTVIEDFADTTAFAAEQKSPQATVALDRVTEPAKAGGQSGRFTATPTDAAVAADRWAMLGRKHDPLMNLANKGLGVWIEGDGRGELLNLQIKCPPQAYGGFCDRYVRIDFTGWKYVELIEPESYDMVNHGWPYMPRRAQWDANPGAVPAYPAFHFHVMYDQIESLNLWYGDLPTDRKVACHLSPIKALPLKPCKVRNPAITLDGKRLTFPTELESGQYIEFRSLVDCKLYNAAGDVVAELKPTGDVPMLSPGNNTLRLDAEPLPGPHPRLAVTVITQGDPL